MFFAMPRREQYKWRDSGKYTQKPRAMQVVRNLSDFAQKFVSNQIHTFALPLREQVLPIRYYLFMRGRHIGEMAEWSNAAVLKTVDLHGSGGSNPSLSALQSL